MTVRDGFWAGKRVVMTGHTGFKGSWLSLWLRELGADLTGFALPPPTRPSLFDLARVGEQLRSIEGDIRDLPRLRQLLQETEPEVVFHVAAQSLVRPSYEDPVGTYATNVMGTVNLLEAVRETPSVRVVVVVTSDKSYQNNEWVWGYRETDPMGGYDPYSSSKGCAELVTASYRQSYFTGRDHAPAVATVRAGNVVGGGDWARDRLVPDAIRAFERGEPMRLRYPGATRPWQHVVEPLSGYLQLAQRLWGDPLLAEAWNFGPDDTSTESVAFVVRALADAWGDGARLERPEGVQPHEARSLKLDCSKARTRLGWRPRMSLPVTLQWTADWYRRVGAGADARALCLSQIQDYEALS